MNFGGATKRKTTRVATKSDNTKIDWKKNIFCERNPDQGWLQEKLLRECDEKHQEQGSLEERLLCESRYSNEEQDDQGRLEERFLCARDEKHQGVGWKKDSFGKNTPAQTDVDTTGYKRKVYEEISNAMKIAAPIWGAKPRPELAAVV